MISSASPTPYPCPYCGTGGSFILDKTYHGTVRLKFDCATYGFALVTKDMTLGRARYFIKRSECAWKAGFYRVTTKSDTDVQIEQKEMFTR